MKVRTFIVACLMGLTTYACNQGHEGESELAAVNDVVSKGTLVFDDDNSSLFAIIEDFEMDYKVYADGTISYDGSVSFFGKQEEEEGYDYSDSWYWQPIMYTITLLGREFNNLMQINFQNKISLLHDRHLLLSQKYTEEFSSYTTMHGAEILVLQHDSESKTSVVRIKPKDTYSVHPTFVDLGYYDASIIVKVDTSAKIVRIISAKVEGGIQGTKINCKLKQDR